MIDDKPFNNSIQKLLLLVLKEEKQIYPNLASKGFFVMLLHSFLNFGASSEASKKCLGIVKSCHCQQETPQDLVLDDSALKFLLPVPVVDYIHQSDVEDCSKFFGDSSNVCRPDILWY